MTVQLGDRVQSRIGMIGTLSWMQADGVTAVVSIEGRGRHEPNLYACALTSLRPYQPTVRERFNRAALYVAFRVVWVCWRIYRIPARRRERLQAGDGLSHIEAMILTSLFWHSWRRSVRAHRHAEYPVDL